MYVRTTEKSVVYAKKVEMDNKYNLETFDKKQIPALIDVAGKDNWIELKSDVIASILK
ncbi:hypothetical protein ACTID9_02515 [Brevibacillus fluminis]|uniref:hypothetical protein n=1 Tax=Brevibacillus fluminis TaxID=511487 RepID=UPI003F8CC051